MDPVFQITSKLKPFLRLSYQSLGGGWSATIPGKQPRVELGKNPQLNQIFVDKKVYFSKPAGIAGYPLRFTPLREKLLSGQAGKASVTEVPR